MAKEKEVIETIDQAQEELKEGVEIENVTKEETEVAESEEELSPEEVKMRELQGKRMGKFTISIGYNDAVYYRNLLDKAEWKGPQQAYLMLISKTELSSICFDLKEKDKNKRYNVDISSAALESINFFMNTKIGKGEDAAQRLFSASMLLRQAITEINNIDKEIKELDAKMNPKNDEN